MGFVRPRVICRGVLGAIMKKTGTYANLLRTPTAFYAACAAVFILSSLVFYFIQSHAAVPSGSGMLKAMAGGLLVLCAALYAYGALNRRKAAQALQEGQDTFRSVVEQSLVGIMLCDAGGRIIVWNRGLEDITLLPRDEALGSFVWDVEYGLLPGEARSPGMYETFAAGMRSAFASNENFNTRGPYEFVIQRRDGIRICIQDIRFPIQTAGGVIWAGMCYDITARKQTEDALRESEARLKSSQELAHLGDWEFDVKTGRTHWSDEMYRLLGYAPGEITPSLASWISCMHPQDQSTPLMDIASFGQDTVKRAEFRVVRKDGLVRYMLSEAWLVCDESGSPLVARGIMQDITASRAFERELEKHRDHLDELVKQRTAALENEVTERRRTEAELRQSESRFKDLVGNLPGVVYRIACAPDRPALDWTIEYVSDQAEKLAGRPAAQFIGTTLGHYSQFMYPEDVEAVFRSIAGHIATDKPYIMEYRLLHTDGSTRWVMARGQAQKDARGNLQWLEGVIFDITAQKQAEEMRRESEARFKSITESAHDAIIISDEDMRLIYWNDAATRIFGYSAEEMLGKTHEILIFDKGQEEIEQYVASYRTTGVTPFESQLFETAARKKDGTIVQVAMSGASWSVGGKTYYSVIARDMTQHKKSDEALRESEERFRAFAETCPDAVIMADESQAILLYWNAAAEKIFGYTRQEMLGRQPNCLMPPASMQLMAVAIKELCSEGHSRFMDGFVETVALRKSGEEFPCELAVFHWVTSGGPKGVVGIILRDITQRKRAEEALRESEERFRAFAETSPDAVVMADESQAILYWNASAERIFGYTGQEMLGRQPDCLMSPSYMQQMAAAADELYSEGRSRFMDGFKESRALRKSGEEFPCELAVFHSLTSGMPKGVVGVILRDITQRKRAEDALRESEARFRAFAEACPDAVVMTDESQAILYWNASAERIFGYTRQEMLGQQPDCLMSTAAMQRRAEAAEELYKEGSSRFMDGFVETAALRKNGEEFPCELAVFHWLTSDIPQGVMGAILRDITQRKRAEEALRASQEKLAGIISAVTAFMVMVDENFRIIWANDHALQTFGSDILNKTCHEAYHGLAWPCENCNVRGCFASGLPVEYEHVITTPDGRQLDLWCTTSIAARHEDGSPKHLVHISYDITERKKMQAEALHASHLASIGELAAGVAHEINNPINGIINCADILKHQFEKTGQDADVPSRIIREGERVAAIVKSLLTFAQERKGKIEPQDVRSMYADAFDLFTKQFEKHFIITRHDFPEDLPRVLAQHQQIQQVFLNLLSNARYALNRKYPNKDPDKLLKVTARAIKIEGQPFVRITFHDHGTGTPAGELEKLCNPFYSTKPAGEGTGLGLSISYNIIKDHGGRLQFETREGHYMRVLVDLPAAK